MPENITNSQSQKPNFYYARHMQPGTCRYDKEMILVDTDTMKQMIRTGAGIPVFIHHQSDVPLDEVKEKAAGYVTDSFYNEVDGWAWFKIMAIDDEVRIAISNGWSVSNAYRPTNWGAAGTKNNVPYDREILGAEFTHLAIVPNPRYEEACIMSPEDFKTYQENQKSKLTELHNDNPSKGQNPMLKFFKNSKEEVKTIDLATHVEVEGKLVTIEEMMNAVKKNSDVEKTVDKEDKEDFKKLENEVVDVDGEKMPIKELVNRFTKMKKNEADADEKAKKDKEDKENAEKKNAEDEAKKKADDEEKKNAEEKAKKDEDEKTNGKGFYETLLNAHENAPKDSVTVIETTTSMVARGSSRYG